MGPDVWRSKFKDFSKKSHKRCHKRLELLLRISTDSVVKNTNESVNVTILVWLREIGVGIRIPLGLVVVVDAEVEERIHKIGYWRLENWCSQVGAAKYLQNAWSRSRKSGQLSRIVLAEIEQKLEGFGQCLGIGCRWWVSPPGLGIAFRMSDDIL